MFTTENGHLIIRSDVIRQIADDVKGFSFVRWEAGSEILWSKIQGTALENAVRIQQEELDLIARIEEHRQQLQRRIAEGYPAIPVQRGKQ